MYQVQFPPQSNRASWVFIGMITDLDNNPIDLTGCSMIFEAKAPVNHHQCVGTLEASTANGKLTFVSLGTFRWFFTLTDMQALTPGTFDTGLTLTNNDGTQTVQLSVGPLPIVDGVVPAA